MSNKHFKTEGIIIRKTDLNEADRIVTVLTPEFGKIDCIAKGARRIKSKFCGRLDLFFRVNLSCFQGRELASLNEVQLLSGFSMEKDVNQHRVLFYIAEITNKLIQSQQQIEKVYPLLLETLEHLEESDKYETILHTYLTKLLTCIGFIPPWNRCAICDDRLDAANPIYLNKMDVNTVCQECKHPGDEIIRMPLLKWVNFMQHYPVSAATKVNVERNEYHEVWRWLQGILENLLSGPIKSERFLEFALIN